jgi:hypothetical protein
MDGINLNDSQYELKTVKIFNNGDAGVVNSCSIRAERKKATDADNAPAYKLILSDASGAEINKGYFDGFSQSSEAALGFFVKEMKHLASLLEFTLPESVTSYKELLDVAMKGVYDNCAGKTVNVFVSYGTKERPKKYLEIASAFAITKASEKPWANPKAQMTRIDPTAVVEEEGNELPSGTPPAGASSGW